MDGWMDGFRKPSSQTRLLRVLYSVTHLCTDMARNEEKVAAERNRKEVSERCRFRRTWEKRVNR